LDSMRSASSPEPIDRFPWRPRVNDVIGIVGLYAMIRLALVAVGIIAWGYQLSGSKTNWRGVSRATGIRYALVADQPLLDMWTRWDSWEYEEIARTGYWYDFNHKPRPYGTVACFPLYPLLTRGVGLILGGRFVLAGLLISNLAALSGMVLLFQWANWWGDRRAAWMTVSAAMTFPVGLFWSALYPQSLFFALAVGSLTLMLDGRVAGSCLLTALATATRLEAVALIPTLLLIRVSRGWRLVLADLWFLVTPLGLLAYMAYLQSRWGDPLLFLRVHSLFGRGLTNPLWTLVNPIRDGTARLEPAVLGTYLVFGLLVFGFFTRVRRSILLYGWLLFLIPLASGVYISIYRVHLVNLAIYLVIGLGFRGGWRWLGWALVAISALCQEFLMFYWVIGGWLP
jgi:hypothetical protein